MKKPECYRLMDGESFVGFKRVVIEYLIAGEDKWVFAEPVHTSEVRLTTLPLGIATLKRDKIKPESKGRT